MEDERVEFDRSEFDRVLEHADFARLIVMNRGEVKIIPVCFEFEPCKCGIHLKITGEGLRRLKLHKGEHITLEFEAAFAGKVIIVIAEAEVCGFEEEHEKCCCHKILSVIVRIKDVDIECFDIACGI